MNIFMIMVSASQVFKTIWSILLAFLVLLIMVTVHEFGHYIAGKIFKFKINEFAIGFGPALLKKTKKNGEIFSIRAFPLGGYCAFDGEDEEIKNEDSFNNKAPWKRIIVLISGALMNFITAIIMICLSFSIFGQLLLYPGEMQKDEANVYGEYVLQEKDIIKEVNGKSIYMISDLSKILDGKKEGEIISLKVIRNKKDTLIEVKLRSDVSIKNLEETSPILKALGVNKLYSTNVKFGFFETIGRSFTYAFKIAGTIFVVLGQLLTGDLSISSLGGPISTIGITSQLVSQGLMQFLEISAFIGVNLAVFNLLPIPALDGSRVVFTTIEWVRGKPINRKVEAMIHACGLIVLFGFAFLVDILKLF